jgi:hypothetical protein
VAQKTVLLVRTDENKHLLTPAAPQPGARCGKNWPGDTTPGELQFHTLFWPGLHFVSTDRTNRRLGNDDRCDEAFLPQLEIFAPGTGFSAVPEVFCHDSDLSAATWNFPPQPKIARRNLNFSTAT